MGCECEDTKRLLEALQKERDEHRQTKEKLRSERERMAALHRLLSEGARLLRGR